MISDKITKETQSFLDRIENMSPEEKKLFHFRTVMNFSKGIKNMRAKESDPLKELLISYFKELKDLDYTILNKEESFTLYKKYLFRIGQYLIKQKDFRTRGSVVAYIVLGLLIDLVPHYYYTYEFYPIASIALVLVGYYRRAIKKKQGEYFSPWW